MKHQEKGMKEINENFTLSGYSTETQIASGLTSFVTAIIDNIKRFTVRMQQEQAEAKHQLNRKHQIQKQIYQDTIGQMTVEQKLKMGIYRF